MTDRSVTQGRALAIEDSERFATIEGTTIEELRAELAKGEEDIKARRVSRLDIDEIKKAARDRYRRARLSKPDH